MWLTILARVGYAAKGVVYFLIGVRALQAVTQHVRPAGSQEAVQRWGQELGEPFLVALGIGLGCFALWRGVQVVLNPDDRWWGARLGCALSGLLYAKLGKGALELAMERPDPDDPREQERLAAFLFTQPLGQAAVAIAGLLVVGVGVFQLVKAYRAKFEEQPAFSRAAVMLARFGLVARGVVFMVGGGYIVRAAWTLNPRQVASLSEILSVLQRDGGRWVLAAMALGLMAYGAAMWVQARTYRMGHSAA